MLYTREIEDPILIQLIILHALHKSNTSISYDDLMNLVLGNCNISYIDFRLALDNLIRIDYIRARLENPRLQIYSITQRGTDAVEFFRLQIPVYIREPIEQSVTELFNEKRRKKAENANKSANKNAVYTHIELLSRGEYKTECSLYDGNNACLMSLALYSDSKTQAEENARQFNERSGEIYSRIIRAFSPETRNGDE